MQTEREQFSQKHETAIVALLEQPTLTKAAEKIGVNQATLFRWLKEEDFRERYFEVRREAVSQAVSRLQQVMTGAVDILYDIGQDKNVAANVRVTAAKAIIDRAIKGVELEDIEVRLTRLEKAK